MINRLKYLYAILYTVTSLGPQNWVIKKFIVMNDLYKEMKKRNTYQGKNVYISNNN